MFEIDGKYAIVMTRGDTATLEFRFTGDPPGENDAVISALKRTTRRGAAPVWEKDLLFTGSGTEQDGTEYSTWIMEIPSADTLGLDSATYFWDLRILYVDGQITTPFDSAPFNVTDCVTDLPDGDVP